MAFTLVDVGLAGGPSLIDGLFTEDGAIDLGALAESALAPSPAGPPLPAYPLVLFADLAAGKDQVNVIALPFADRATAESAAVVLADRLRTWQPGKFQQPVLDVIGGAVSTAVVDDVRVAPAAAATFVSVTLAVAADAEGAPDGAAAEPTMTIPEVAPGGAVALVAIRYPLPASGSRDRPSAFLSIALQAIYNRDFAPLAIP
jgi:hypothetical protein